MKSKNRMIKRKSKSVEDIPYYRSYFFFFSAVNVYIYESLVTKQVPPHIYYHEHAVNGIFKNIIFFFCFSIIERRKKRNEKKNKFEFHLIIQFIFNNKCHDLRGYFSDEMNINFLLLDRSPNGQMMKFTIQQKFPFLFT